MDASWPSISTSPPPPTRSLSPVRPTTLWSYKQGRGDHCLLAISARAPRRGPGIGTLKTGPRELSIFHPSVLASAIFASPPREPPEIGKTAAYPTLQQFVLCRYWRTCTRQIATHKTLPLSLLVGGDNTTPLNTIPPPLPLSKPFSSLSGIGRMPASKVSINC